MKKIYISALLSLAHFILSAQTDFITTWKTDNPGNSASNQITIPTYAGQSYNYSVSWGDGSTNNNVNGNITHTYSTSGTYQVSISGTFPGIFFGTYDTDNEKIISIDQWGDNTWGKFNSAFNSCSNLVMTATDAPDLSAVTSTAGTFVGCKSLVGNGSIGSWDVSSIEDMNNMFNSANSFNEDISSWNVSNVIDMNDMFHGASSFNQNIGNWNVAAVKDMNSMFESATSFNADIGSWNVSKVETMGDMFWGASSFNQDIGDWDVGEVQSMSYMFKDAVTFNQDIGNWDVKNVLQMYIMFSGAISFDQNLGEWNIGKVQFMTDMFAGVTLSTENYDNILIGWSNLPLIQNGVQFSGGNSKYCNGLTARQSLITNHGWTIIDDGDQCSFETTWRTNNPGISGNNQITIPTFPGETYDYTVHWGDGTSDSGVVGNITHTYDTYGTYNVSIKGVFPRIYFNYELGNSTADEKKLIRINQWGNTAWSSMVDAFFGCINLNVTANDTPNLSNITSTSGMFRACESLVGTTAFNDWDVSTVTDMTTMFFDAKEFNMPINDWDVSNVQVFNSTFNGATKFNQPLNNWNLASANYIGGMFLRASAFNQDIANWNVSSVTEMGAVFSGATSFNQDLRSWDVSKVTNMRGMFQGATFYNQDMSSWDVGKVEFMNGMFRDCDAFNQDISSWNVQNVIYMNWMFSGAASFNQDISGWNVSNVIDMHEMFKDANVFNQPIGSWVVDKVTDMSSMFEGASNFDQNIGGWNVAMVSDMTNMFQDAKLSGPNYDALLIGWSALQGIRKGVPFNAGSSQYCQGGEARQHLIDNEFWTITDNGIKCPFITTWVTDNPGASQDNQITIPVWVRAYNYQVDWGDGTSNSGVTGEITHTYATPGTYQVSISGTFPTISFRNQGDAKKLISVDQWGDIQWGDMVQSFKGCSNMDVLATDTPNLTNSTTLGGMFANCTSLIGNESFNHWDTSGVVDMGELFNSASNFNQDIGDWDVGNVESMGSLFILASSFNQDISKWNVSNVTSMQAMFQGAERFNQDIGDWNVSNVTTMLQMFTGASAFNQDIGKWNVSNVSRMYSMFLGASSFNQDISPWDVSKVESMSYMFNFATSFDQNLGDWTVTQVTEMNEMFRNAGLSTENYDALLNGWSSQTLDFGVNFHAGDSKYCEAGQARQKMIDVYQWTIMDSGEGALCSDDVDNDGVLDYRDDCLNSPERIIVNENGCTDLYAYPENLTIKTVSETCPDSDNAQISILTTLPQDYVATIEGAEYDFTSNLIIDDLSPGTYELCVAVDTLSFQQCYELTIVGAANISGKSSSESGKIFFAIDEGTAPYTVKVNGASILKTSLKAFSVAAEPGDTIEVVTDKACEGSLYEKIDMLAEWNAYPNPTTGSFEIELTTSKKEVMVAVFTLDSQLISSESYPVINGKVELDISNLSKGVYLAKVQLENPISLRIVKQ